MPSDRFVAPSYHRMVAALSDRLLSTMDDETEPARDYLLPFVRRLFPDYTPARHHELVAEHLEAVEAGTIARLMIVLPPRHGKSELASINFPAWYLGRHPDRRIIACSHTASLAYRFSRQARAKLAHVANPFAVQLASGVSAVQQWDIAGHRGGYIAAGVSGPITGQGADLLIIDDPVKSADQAASPVLREKAWEWYQGTVYPRLEHGAAIVVIGTRWHHDDLIGRLLAAEAGGGEAWTVLHLPAIAADADLLGRQPGEALWPAKYDRDALARIERTIGPYQFSAQYQGTPGNRETSILTPDSWAWYDTPDDHYVRIVAFCDTAFKSTQRADYSVVSIWGERAGEAGYDVLDVWRDRVDFPALVEVCERLRAGRWRPTHWIVEDKASGQSLVQVLRQRRFPVEAYEPGTRDKLERVHAISGYVRSGLVRLPRRAAWTDAFVAEHADFPSGTHDDQVDTTAMALHWFEVAPTQRPVPISLYVGKIKTRWGNPLA